LDTTDSTHVARRGKPRDVADYSAAERDNRTLASKSVPRESAAKLDNSFRSFVRFSGGECYFVHGQSGKNAANLRNEPRGVCVRDNANRVRAENRGSFRKRVKRSNTEFNSMFIIPNRDANSFHMTFTSFLQNKWREPIRDSRVTTSIKLKSHSLFYRKPQKAAEKAAVNKVNKVDKIVAISWVHYKPRQFVIFALYIRKLSLSIEIFDFFRLVK
jgi:hypothetical protein